jgi:membrane associated rhomboid family serine protease
MARRLLGSFSVPPVTLRLLIVTAVVTLGAVIAQNFGFSLPLELLILQPAAVLHRFEIWKLLTYVFVADLEPIQFLINLVVLYFFGGWFERSFGPKRFLRFYLLSAAGAGLLPLMLGLVWPAVANFPYLGAWSVFEALTVAMAVLQPGAQVYFYMVLPVSARQLMYLSWALIGLFIIFYHSPVPYLTAIGGIGMGFALSLGVNGPRRWWLRFQSARLERQLRRRAQHLRVVPRNGEDKSKDSYLH